MIHSRPVFFDRVRNPLFGGRLRTGQVQGLDVLLNTCDHLLPDRRQLAYLLATAHHETARTMQPIREYGFGKGKPYGKRDPETGQVYAGRGYVQLTWRENYAKMAAVTGLDLVHNPDLALEPLIAAQIMRNGMIDGMFTGKKLADYFNGGGEDWINARRIINGLDKAETIARYAHEYLAALE